MSDRKKQVNGGLILCILSVVLLIIALTDIYLHSTERYLITGEKNGEKLERVVSLHHIYRKQSASAPIIRETDGYGETYHHIYYTKAADDDTIYGFDTIQEIRKL